MSEKEEKLNKSDRSDKLDKSVDKGEPTPDPSKEGKKDATGATKQEELDKRLEGELDKAKERLSGKPTEPTPDPSKEGKEREVSAAKEGKKREASASKEGKETGDKEEIIEEDKKDVPQGLNEEHAGAFWTIRAKQRREREAWQKEKQELENRLSEARGQRSEVRGQGEGEKAGGGEKVERNLENNTKVFQLRATAQRVLNGEPMEGWDEKKAKEVLSLADSAKSEMDNPQHCLEIIRKARAGEFGEVSAEIAADAERELPLIQERGRQLQLRQQEESQRIKDLQGMVSKKLDEAYEKYPALKEDGENGRALSDETKFGREWMKKHVLGEQGKPGPRYAEIFSPERVPGLIDDMMNAYRASKFEQMQAEQQRKEREQEHEETPLGSGGAPNTTDADGVKPGSEEALNKIIGKYGR